MPKHRLKILEIAMNELIPIWQAIAVFSVIICAGGLLAYRWNVRAFYAGRQSMEREMKRAHLRQVSNQLRLSHPQPFFRAVRRHE